MTDDIAFMPRTRLLALYRAKQLSPVEVIKDALHRLDNSKSSINAFVLYDPETAFPMARASEARWQKGEPQGLLDGVPVALKDTLLTRGWPRLLGSRRSIPIRLATTRRYPAGCGLTAQCFSARRRPPNSAGRGNGLAAKRRHPQPVEPGANPRRQQRGQRRRGAGRHRSSRGRPTPAARSASRPHSAVLSAISRPSGELRRIRPRLLAMSHFGPLTRTVGDAALMLDAMKGPTRATGTACPMTGSLIASASAKA